ncbi:MAG TPA: 30S ribosomal protein S1 [Geobacteraceae bacterium]
MVKEPHDMPETDEEEQMEGESFADLFAKSYQKEERLKPGQVVEARIIKITSDWIFIDTGRKGEGVLDRKELLDAEGALTVTEGDSIRAYFLSSRNGELRFTTRVGGGSAANSQLEEAWRSGIPVDGHVEKEVKGGFEVKLAGSVRAFCPFSQMGLRRGGEASAYIGKHLPFRVTNYSEGGRNIVVSNRAILEEESRRQKESLKESLQVGMRVKGTVTSLRDFGAFVDLGGADGLIPMAEIAWGRVKDVREVLTVGQEVEVVVKQIDWERDRISLSLRDTLADPWEQVPERFPVGSVHSGKVSRLAAFGAFVTLAEGIDGLLHIAKLGKGKRIAHPREVLREGEEVEVIVEGIDREAKRISLALAEVKRAQDEEEKSIAEFRRGQEAAPAGSMGSLGDLLKAKLEKK